MSGAKTRAASKDWSLKTRRVSGREAEARQAIPKLP